MSREEREYRAFFEEIDSKAAREFSFDTEAFTEVWNREKEIEAGVKAYEAAQAAEKAHAEKIRTDPTAAYNSMCNAFKKAGEDGSMQKWLDDINNHCKETIRKEQERCKLVQSKRDASYEHLADMHDMDYIQLKEAKVERTKAELIDDYEAVEKLNKEIKNIEERLLFYSEQMKLIEAEEN